MQHFRVSECMFIISFKLVIIHCYVVLGCGFNLNNKVPTVCINDMITELNKASGKKIPLLSQEKYFAGVFSQLEKLLLLIELGQQDKVLELYYKYWLHGYVLYCNTGLVKHMH